jgi:2-hydroxychromene-2-carboxylate isomerase
MINMGREDDKGDYTQAEADPEPRQHGYDIGAEPLFPTVGMSMEEGMTAKGQQATHWQRTRSFVKLGWRYQLIPFAAPSKRD